MNRWSRLIIIFIAYGLALLHTAVPHQHGPGADDRMVFSPAGCVFQGSLGTLLQRVFATDLGVGHLESFKKGGDSDIDRSALTIPLVFISTLLIYVPRICRNCDHAGCVYSEKLRQQLLLFSSGQLRAPPVFA